MLKNYATYKMAMEMLGAKLESRNTLYRIIDKHGVETKSIGKMRLVNRHQLADAAGISPDGEPRFPVHIAWLDEETLMSAQEAAEIMGLSKRHVNLLASNYDIDAYDLSEWGGQVVIPMWAISEYIEKMERKKAFSQIGRSPRGTFPPGSFSDSVEKHRNLRERV